MKRIFISVGAATILTLSFTGCGAGLNMNGISQSDVKQVFKRGSIESSQKVLVGKSKLTTLGYATAGAVAGAGAGAVLGDSTKATVGGGVIGAGIGALASVFQEVEAYQVDIKDIKNGNTVTAWLEKEVPLNSLVEYVVRADGEVTNVNVTEIGKPKEIITEREKIIYKDKPIQKKLSSTKKTVTPVEKEVVKEVAIPVHETVKKEVDKKVEAATKEKTSSFWE